jgi:hypothetical protein
LSAKVHTETALVPAISRQIRDRFQKKV